MPDDVGDRALVPANVTDVAGTWCFRIRFRMGTTVRLQTDDSQWVLSAPDEDWTVVLKPTVADQPLKEAEQLVIVGKGYGDEQAATTASVAWCSAVQRAFARLGIGADFGYRAPTGSHTEAGLRWLEELHSLPRILNDVHGVMVYAEHPEPRFVSQSATGVVLKPQETISVAIEAARTDGVELDDRETIAYDLFSAAFFQPSADARFLMLMMALETLIEQPQRPNDVQLVITELIDQVKQRADLETSEKQSLLGSLEPLRQESVGRAGRRLAATLGDRRYMEKTPTAFFTECYEVRSSLVHGHFPRPTRDEVDILAAHLQTFVGHLISGPLASTVSD